jgi:diguanylate cyclase (GGDEF)-like protein/PAS domain S-box-containing protein
VDQEDVAHGHDPLLIPGPERQAAIARMVFDVLDAGVVVQGPKGRIATANPAAAEIFGVALDDMMEARLEELPGRLLRADGTELPSDELPSQMAVRTGAAQLNVLVGLASPDRALRWIEISAQPLSWNGETFAVVSSIRDVTTRRMAEEALAHQARHDPVTGLPNRRLLMDRLDLALARAERSGRRVAVLFYDVDHFKLVNDSLGHHVGDAVLQQLAERFREGARAADTVVRFGGDEFVVVCEDLDQVEDALEIAERLTAAMKEPLLIDRSTRIVTVSAGVAISEPGDTPSSLLRDADAAMNLAKEKGRDRIDVFSDDVRNHAVRRLDLDTALRLALQRDELHLVYQPVLTVEGERVVGCEALLRWVSAEHGPITPAEFIPLAERSGLIGPIGAWVIRQAVRQLAEWHRDALVPDGFWTAINISGRQLGDPDLVAVITDTLAAAEVDPHLLHLEVTESAIIEDLATSIERLDELKTLGVHIDVDDFGTGYSSLSYLKRLPINTLKVDQSFTDGLGSDPHDTSIVLAIISLGHALDLDIVAEGVETATHLDELRLLGCDLAQGYHWSRPIPPAELVTWIAGRATDAP